MKESNQVYVPRTVLGVSTGITVLRILYSVRSLNVPSCFFSKTSVVMISVSLVMLFLASGGGLTYDTNKFFCKPFRKFIYRAVLAKNHSTNNSERSVTCKSSHRTLAHIIRKCKPAASIVRTFTVRYSQHVLNKGRGLG